MLVVRYRDGEELDCWPFHRVISWLTGQGSCQDWLEQPRNTQHHDRRVCAVRAWSGLDNLKLKWALGGVMRCLCATAFRGTCTSHGACVFQRGQIQQARPRSNRGITLVSGKGQARLRPEYVSGAELRILHTVYTDRRILSPHARFVSRHGSWKMQQRYGLRP